MAIAEILKEFFLQLFVFVQGAFAIGSSAG